MPPLFVGAAPDRPREEIDIVNIKVKHPKPVFPCLRNGRSGVIQYKSCGWGEVIKHEQFHLVGVQDEQSVQESGQPVDAAVHAPGAGGDRDSCCEGGAQCGGAPDPGAGGEDEDGDIALFCQPGSAHHFE
ncbi:hypothetical protein OsI_32667 [Oryza sativa Indica Group]|uniref:Uncharacterized protein n=1 Tax=Oryza sativa subsp. indica TaxID=39946 RepID=A2Z4U2_ORYSI|nr:hypothetical protein OsI_32667 [Oryza sativa Indica Group]